MSRTAKLGSLVIATVCGALVLGNRAAAEPAPFKDVKIEGALLDPPERLRATLELGRRAQVVDQQRLAQLLDELDYEVKIVKRGSTLVLRLRPHRRVRRIYITGNNWPLMPLFEEEILRRVRFRPGQQLPEGAELASALGRQEERMQRFLAREGSFEGRLRIRCRRPGGDRWQSCLPSPPADERGRVDLQVGLRKGRSYKVGDVKVVHNSPTAVLEAGESQMVHMPPLTDDEIEEFFHHRILFYRRSFNTERFKEDVASLKRRYQRLGYPGVRISESFAVNPCRPSSEAVRIKLKIQPRRRIEIAYKGNDNLKPLELDEALTIYESGAYDDYELEQSVQALRKLYQTKGYLHAQVAFGRKRLDALADRVTFTIKEGPRVRVESVAFKGNRRISSGELEKVIRTRTFPWLGYIGLGEGGYVTEKQLRQDTQRITELYHARGFDGVKVSGRIVTDPALLRRPPASRRAGAAPGASSLIEGRGSEAHVRFTIVEGDQLLVSELHVDAAVELSAGPDAAVPLPQAGQDVGDRASSGRDTSDRASPAPDVADRATTGSQARPAGAPPGPSLPGPLDSGGAGLKFSREDLLQRIARAGLAPGSPFTAAKLKAAKGALLAFYAEHGHPYAEIQALEALDQSGTRVELQFTVKENEPVRFGPVFVRGNFKTRERVILGALDFKAGDTFDIGKIRQAERVLRKLDVFNSVRIQLLGLRERPEDVPVLIRVEERHDDYGALEFAVGGSTDNAFFGAVGYSNRNVLGFGTALELRGELGIEIRSANARYTDPRLFNTAFELDTTGFWRQEITERLGDVTTFGTAVSVSREIVQHLTGSVRYEIRRVKRQEDLNRPAGSRDEFSRVDVLTTVAGFGPGLIYDRRDNPLSPSRGFRLASSLLVALDELGGTDDFLKINANGQGYLPLPLGITIALGVRYDHGVPLGGNVLLPKVERFFAGGDTTIRGFEEDRAFAERIGVPLVPFGGGTIVQVEPQGGNIRLLTNLELQFPIWKESPLLGRDLMAALFIDNGVVLNSFEAFEWSDFRHGAGAALRVVLPVGFASFEYAFALDPKPGDPKDGRFHFNFGFIL